jgi:hypothetical protein
MSTTDGRTDTAPTMPRWLTLVLASAATLIAIGTLWALAPSTVGCPEGDWYIGFADDPGILPGPQPCGTTDGTGPALTTAGILLALLAAVFVVAFTVVRHRGRVLLIIGGAMLLVLIIGLLATVTLATAQPPIVHY